MKLISRDFEKNGEGQVTLVIENEEDVWNIYNLIQVGDSLRSSTIRKVSNESSTGSVNVKSVRLNLTVSVECITYDSLGSSLHLKGRSIEESKHVKLGAYHTLDLEIGDKFTLRKSDWDSVATDLVDSSTDVSRQADVAAIIMHEGLANLCLLTASTTIVRTKIELVIPRKRRAQVSQHEKGIDRFFSQILNAIERHIRFDVIKCLIIASPGFLKDQFFQYYISEATKLDKKVLLENRSKILLVHSTSGHKHSLQEVLADPICLNRLSDTKATSEVSALDQLFEMMKIDPCRAFYGKKHVLLAVDAIAVETLLICDTLFRSIDIKERQFFVSLVDRVKESQGLVRIFSAMHTSGEQLMQLSGVAAILRFPIPEPESDDESEVDFDEYINFNLDVNAPNNVNQQFYSSNNTSTLVSKFGSVSTKA